MEPQRSTTLAGRYRLERELGAGGMATVFARRESSPGAFDGPLTLSQPGKVGSRDTRGRGSHRHGVRRRPARDVARRV